MENAALPLEPHRRIEIPQLYLLSLLRTHESINFSFPFVVHHTRCLYGVDFSD